MKLPFERDEGVVCAWIPITDFIAQSAGVFAVYDDMVVDIEPAHQPCKWWRVKAAARYYGLNHPEPIWTGPAEEFAVQSLPGPNRRHEHMQLAVRSYQRGPWVLLGAEHEPKVIIK